MIMRMKTRLLQPIIKKVLVILPLYLFAFLPLTAQTYTQRIQKTTQGQGTVTIHQDAAIDELVNGGVAATPKKESKPAAKSQTTTPKSQTPAQTPKPQTPKPAPQNQTPAVAVNELEKPSTDSDEQSNVQKRSYKTTGYRIQVFAGGNTRRDRQRAEQAGNSLRQLYPGEDVYVHFYSPRWICRLGNYRTYEEAHEKMLEIRKMGYESATVVKGKITVTQ